MFSLCSALYYLLSVAPCKCKTLSDKYLNYVCAFLKSSRNNFINICAACALHFVYPKTTASHTHTHIDTRAVGLWTGTGTVYANSSRPGVCVCVPGAKMNPTACGVFMACFELVSLPAQLQGS